MSVKIIEKFIFSLLIKIQYVCIIYMDVYRVIYTFFNYALIKTLFIYLKYNIYIPTQT